MSNYTVIDFIGLTIMLCIGGWYMLVNRDISMDEKQDNQLKAYNDQEHKQ